MAVPELPSGGTTYALLRYFPARPAGYLLGMKIQKLSY
jgi:hypothetical protein